MRKGKRLLAFFLMMSMLLPMLPISSLIAWANDIGSRTSKTDAMEAIKSDDYLSASMQGETQRFSDDGYIGIPYEVTVYYDEAAHGKATPGNLLMGGTPVILYVVNADFERIGTDSDVSIITSMLGRGYAVIVLDYLNDARAKSPDLDWSTMPLWMKAEAGEYFKELAAFEKGTYIDTLTVPSGYDVLLNDVFFEQDKHGVDGTLEEIVKVWNNDFRSIRASYVVKWVHEDGTRKATQNAFDGSSPVWYSDPAGTVVDQENGQYIKVAHTKALTITDCVKPDGSPLNMDLHSHYVYPTNPDHEVPVVVLFSAGNSVAEIFRKADRPHFTGFLFNGYAGMVAEYAYVPMELTHSLYGGEFSGTHPSGVTNENMIYATYTYNATQASTAALRRARYLALSQPETYRFDIDHFGAFGLSRNAWHTQLGAPVLRNDLISREDGYTDEEIAQHVNDKVNSFVQLMLPEQCSGRTRYDNGKTEGYTVDGVTIDGGELQPWAVYDGKEISSGLQANHSSCGGFVDYFCEGYAPQFVTVNLSDNYTTQYGKQNEMINLSRTMNVATLWFETDIPHSFAYGVDRNYGVDVYEAYFDFMGYYLKGDAVRVAYADPVKGAVIRTTDGITVKFIGDVTADEIQKVTIKDGAGNVLTGTWTSAYGNTEWTFLADDMKGNTAYTLTVPADLAGSNGVAMGTAYTTTFHTRPEGDATVLVNGATINENGTNVTLTVPEAAADGYALRVLVSNNAANTLKVYDASTNALVNSLRVSGAGYHEIDVTEALAAYEAGSEVTFRLFTENAGDNVAHWEQTFDTDNGGLTFLYCDVTTGAEIDGALALKLKRKVRVGQAEHVVYHNMGYDAITTNKLIKNGAAVTKEDLGRTFLITLRVYDTVSRPVRFYMNHLTAKATDQFDYDRCYYTGMTVANEWTEFEIPYTVYEMKYGCMSQVKELTVQITPLGGSDEPPIYLDNLKVEEVFTDLSVASVSLVSEQNSGKPVKAPASQNAFKVGSTEYATWKDAMNAAASGATVTMQSSYTLTDSDLVNLSGKTSLTIDLNGYRLTAKNTKNAPLWISATNTTAVSVTLKNGSVILGNTPLVGYGSSTTAGNGKVINVNVENVYLTVAKGSASYSIVSEGSVASGVKLTSNITLTDSTIDVLRENFLDQTLNDVFVLHSGLQGLSVRYAFVGGSLVMNSIHNTVLCESILTVSPNASGQRLQVLVPENVSAPTASFKLEDSYGSLQLSTTQNGYKVYEVLNAELSTPYGAVANEFADATVYPFAIFMDEAFISGAKSWSESTVIARATLNKKPGSTLQILMRGDREVTEFPNWLCHMNGTIILDLGGKTLHQKTASLFEAGVDASYSGNFDTTLIVKNGNVIIGNNNFCGVQNHTNRVKNFDISFEDVYFSVDTEIFDGTKRKNLFYAQDWMKGQVNINLTLTDCTLDLRGITTPYTLFDYATYSPDLVAANVTFIGGAVIADSFSNITWYTANEATDKVCFKKGSNGSWVTLSVPNGTVPSVVLPTEDGAFGFSKLISDGDDRDVYTKNPLHTSYGLIGDSYADPAVYPFALFDGDKNFVGGGSDWRVAQDEAGEYLAANPGKTVYILMRADHTNATDSAPMGTFNGTVVIDLGGFTFNRGLSPLIEANNNGMAETDSAFITNIIVKNGKLYAGKQGSADGHIVTVQATDDGTYNKTYNIVFENVTFAVSKENYTAGLNAVVAYSSNETGTGVITAGITLRDSTFSFVNTETTVVPTSAALFSGYNNKNKVSIVFEGGKWEGSASGLTLSELDSALCPVTFKKNAGSEYFKYDITSGEPFSGAVNTDKGEGYFVPGNAEGEYILDIEKNDFEGYFEGFTNMTDDAGMYADGADANAIANDKIVPDPTNSGKGNVWSVDVATHAGKNTAPNSDIQNLFNYATHDSVVYQLDFYVEKGAVGELGVDAILYLDGANTSSGVKWYGLYSLDFTNGKIIPTASNAGSTVTAYVNDASFKTEIWYTFAMALNLKTGAYSLYLDGYKLMDAQLPVKNIAIGAGSAQMYINKAKSASDSGTVYYDNVTVYEGTEPADVKEGKRPYEDFTNMTNAADMYASGVSVTDQIVSDPTSSGKGNVWKVDVSNHWGPNYNNTQFDGKNTAVNSTIAGWFDYTAHNSIVYQYDFYVEAGATGQLGVDAVLYKDGSNTSNGAMWHGLYTLDLTNGKITHNSPFNGGCTVTETVNDATFKPDTWYTFAIVLDLKTSAYSLYLDGYKLMEAQLSVKNFKLSGGGLYINKAYAVGAITSESSEPTAKSTGTVYYDNITLYDGTEPANVKVGKRPYSEDFTGITDAVGMYADGVSVTDQIVSDPTSSGKGNVWKVDVASHSNANHNPNAAIKKWFNYAAHDSIVYQFDFYVEKGAVGQIGFDSYLPLDGSNAGGGSRWHGFYSLDLTNRKIIHTASNGGSTVTATVNDASFKTGRWYTFAMALDLKTGAYSLYLDGYKVMDAQMAVKNVSFNVSGSTMAFQKAPSSGSSGTVYYDNVTVYEGTAPTDVKVGVRPYENFTGMTSAADMYASGADANAIAKDAIVSDPTSSGKGNVWKVDVNPHYNKNTAPNADIQKWFNYTTHDSVVYQFDFYVEKGAVGELGVDAVLYADGSNTSSGVKWYGLYSLDFTNGKIIPRASNSGSTVNAYVNDATFKPDTWYNFAMVLDLKTGAYSLYLDGYKLMDAQLPVANIKLGVGSAQMYINKAKSASDSGTVYYDNITVYEGTEPVDVKVEKRPYEDFTGMTSAADMYASGANADAIAKDAIIPDPTSSGKGNVWSVDVKSHYEKNTAPNADIQQWFNYTIHNSVVYQFDFYVAAGSVGQLGVDAVLYPDGSNRDKASWYGLYSLDLTNGRIIPRASNSGSTVTAYVNDTSFKPDTWYTFAMVLDLKTGAYSLYLDGYRLMDAQLPVKNIQLGAGSAQMYINKAKSASDSGTVYYDNITVYEGTVPANAAGRAEFTGASVNLGTDLSLLYYVKINDASLIESNALSVRFKVGEEYVTVTDYEIVNGEYVFTLSGIAPQQIGDLIDAELLLDGEVVSSHNGYSIKQNCLNLLEKTPAQLGLSDAKYALLKTLIADLLAYGQAALEYTEYPADDAILDGSEELDFSDKTPVVNDKLTLSGNSDAALHIKSATVRFDTVNKLRIKLYIANAEGVTVTVNGTEYTVADLAFMGNGIYMLSTNAILATEFDAVYTVVLSRNGDAVATLTYSVNAYAYSMYTSATASNGMKTLAVALYRYGASAKAFANAN